MPSIASAIKRVTSGALILGTLGYYSHSWISLQADYAAVVAPKQTLTAPFSGNFDHSLLAGAVIKEGEPLLSVTRVQSLDSELRAVSAEVRGLEAETKSLEALISAGADAADDIKRKGGAIHGRQGRHLAQLADQAAAEVKVKEFRVHAARKAFERGEPLCGSGLLPSKQCDELKADLNIATAELEVAEGEVFLAKSSLETYQAGASVGSSGTPQLVYQKQREDQLQLRQDELQKERSVRHARAVALGRALRDETVTVKASADLRVWSVLKPKQTLVNQAEALVEVAGCSELQVFALLPFSKYERIRIGARAVVTYSGEDYEGTVAQLMGPSVSLTYNARFVPLPPPGDAKGFSHGALIINAPDLTARLAENCEVGASIAVTLDDESS